MSNIIKTETPLSGRRTGDTISGGTMYYNPVRFKKTSQDCAVLLP